VIQRPSLPQWGDDSPPTGGQSRRRSASPDGLQGEEGTFSLCTFFYVDALARSGRLEDARLTFEKMLTYANHVGLFAEEIGLTGEQLGNFPQAFTHLALINAAMNLDYQLDHGAGRVNVV
jgi:GH15 family glucan-1,4-alpha-glucosidase